MAWNDDKKNPWGGDGQTPPELDDVIKDFKEKFSNIIGGSKKPTKPNSDGTITPPTGSLKYIFIVGLLIWALSGIYIIDPAEKGVVLRFGAFQEETSQGPHWHLPYPIEILSRINVEQIRTEQIGYRNAIGNRRGGNVPSESLMLTKDGNIVDVSFEIQYKISSAKDFLFNVYRPKQTLGQISNSVIREVIGKNNTDYVITTGRTEITRLVKEKMQALLNDYQVGIYISSVNFRSSQVPEQVQASYSDVTIAKSDKERYINKAESYANDILPKSRGKAARLLEEAKAYKSKVVSKSEGEASRFGQILAEYKKAPKVTKERLYRETMESVLSNTSKVVVDSKANSMMYLPIDKLLNNNQVRTEVVVGSQPQQVRQGGSIRDVFRNREVR